MIYEFISDNENKKFNRIALLLMLVKMVYIRGSVESVPKTKNYLQLKDPKYLNYHDFELKLNLNTLIFK